MTSAHNIELGIEYTKMAVGLIKIKTGDIKITTLDTLFGMDDAAEAVVQAMMAVKVATCLRRR